jgi:hypothetical protein
MNDTSPVVLKIGPRDAQQLMTNRSHQRNVSKRTVSRYVKDMLEGRWHLTAGAPLALWEDTTGKWGDEGEIYVLNGQHRLLAVIESNTEQEFWVVYETDPEVFMTYDTGLVRGIGTLLQLSNQNRGIETVNSATIASLANLILRYERHPKTLWQSDTVTKAEVVEWVATQDWADLTIAVRDYHQVRSHMKKQGLGMWYGALRWLVHEHSTNASRWYEFHEAISFGTNLSAGDARLTLRNYMLRGQRTKTNHWQRQSELATGIKAWNDFTTDTPRDLLVFKHSELSRSGMPKIQ